VLAREGRGIRAEAGLCPELTLLRLGSRQPAQRLNLRVQPQYAVTYGPDFLGDLTVEANCSMHKTRKYFFK
jgi:hypothetical protein